MNKDYCVALIFWIVVWSLFIYTVYVSPCSFGVRETDMMVTKVNKNYIKGVYSGVNGLKNCELKIDNNKNYSTLSTIHVCAFNNECKLPSHEFSFFAKALIIIVSVVILIIVCSLLGLIVQSMDTTTNN